MSSERIAAAFGDIIQAIGLIEKWVKEAGDQESALAPDTQSRSAIERQLLIISEAAIRLHKLDPELLKRLAPTIDWPGVRGVGNYIRHKYDDLDGAVIGSVVGDKLAELRSACAAAIEALRKPE
jgi:uncharacterized protein with HEPN domain